MATGGPVAPFAGGGDAGEGDFDVDVHKEADDCGVISAPVLIESFESLCWKAARASCVGDDDDDDDDEEEEDEEDDAKDGSDTPFALTAAAGDTLGTEATTAVAIGGCSRSFTPALDPTPGTATVDASPFSTLSALSTLLSVFSVWSFFSFATIPSCLAARWFDSTSVTPLHAAVMTKLHKDCVRIDGLKCALAAVRSNVAPDLPIRWPKNLMSSLPRYRWSWLMGM
jgi:hypothetical protein